MTICIAAIAKRLDSIVAVSDTRLSNEVFSHEYGSMKIRPLRNYWQLMYSGSPTKWGLIYRHISRWLEEKSHPTDLESMLEAVEYAYNREREHDANQLVLSHLGMTRAEFLKNGKRKLTDGVFARIDDEMRQLADARLNNAEYVELIAFGFDQYKDPHLISTWKNGTYTIHDEPGFCAIGWGAPLSLASLQLHEDFCQSVSLGEVCYRMQAAKFAAEPSGFVGPKQTITQVFSANRNDVRINYGAAEAREYFNAERAREIPTDTIIAIENSLSGGWVLTF